MTTATSTRKELSFESVSVYIYALAGLFAAFVLLSLFLRWGEKKKKRERTRREWKVTGCLPSLPLCDPTLVKDLGDKVLRKSLSPGGGEEESVRQVIAAFKSFSDEAPDLPQRDLLLLLKYGDADNEQASAAVYRCVIALCMNSANRKKLAHLRIIRAIARSLQSKQEKKREYSAYLLAQVVRDSAFNVGQAMRVIFPPLCLIAYDQSPRLQRAAAFAFLSLSIQDRARDQLVVSGVVPPLLFLLSSSDYLAQSCSCLALLDLLRHSMLGREGGVEFDKKRGGEEEEKRKRMKVSGVDAVWRVVAALTPVWDELHCCGESRYLAGRVRRGREERERREKAGRGGESREKGSDEKEEEEVEVEEVKVEEVDEVEREGQAGEGDNGNGEGVKKEEREEEGEKGRERKGKSNKGEERKGGEEGPLFSLPSALVNAAALSLLVVRGGGKALAVAAEVCKQQCNTLAKDNMWVDRMVADMERYTQAMVERGVMHGSEEEEVVREVVRKLGKLERGEAEVGRERRGGEEKEKEKKEEGREGGGGEDEEEEEMVEAVDKHEKSMRGEDRLLAFMLAVAKWCRQGEDEAEGERSRWEKEVIQLIRTQVFAHLLDGLHIAVLTAITLVDTTYPVMDARGEQGKGEAGAEVLTFPLRALRKRWLRARSELKDAAAELRKEGARREEKLAVSATEEVDEVVMEAAEWRQKGGRWRGDSAAVLALFGVDRQEVESRQVRTRGGDGEEEEKGEGAKGSSKQDEEGQSGKSNDNELAFTLPADVFLAEYYLESRQSPTHTTLVECEVEEVERVVKAIPALSHFGRDEVKQLVELASSPPSFTSACSEKERGGEGGEEQVRMHLPASFVRDAPSLLILDGVKVGERVRAEMKRKEKEEKGGKGSERTDTLAVVCSWMWLVRITGGVDAAWMVACCLNSSLCSVIRTQLLDMIALSDAFKLREGKGEVNVREAEEGKKGWVMPASTKSKKNNISGEDMAKMAAIACLPVIASFRSSFNLLLCADLKPVQSLLVMLEIDFSRNEVEFSGKWMPAHREVPS